MGNCFSDGGAKSAAAGGGGATSASPNNHHHHQSGAGGAASNDAIDLYLNSHGYRGLFSQIELSLSASNLRDRDTFSKSDPMAVVYTKGRDGKLEEVGRTEVILNSLDPVWIAKHIVKYHFEILQTYVFRVYDVDSQFHNVPVKMLKLDEQQFLGEVTCALSEIVSRPTQSLTLSLVNGEEHAKDNHFQKLGVLTIRAEECTSSKTTAEIIFRCTDLEYKDLFSKSDPFLVISKTVESGSPIPVCKTEVKKNDHNPTWKPVFLNLQQIGTKDTLLTIECFNFNSNGRHDLLGKTQKSLADLENLLNEEGESLFVPDVVGQSIQNKVLKSRLFVEKYSESTQHTFLDYISGGCEMNFMVAVDYTASNGNPRLPDSLHYIDPSGRPNAYQKAIKDVGDVLQCYDSDKRYPCWGFGARPIDGPVSHCFNLSGSSIHSEVDGIQGILTAYDGALHNVQFAGPTLFGPIIHAASEIASQSLANNEHKYFVMLIITDGVITDLQETIDSLVKASDLPLSVLIVGVGGADFKEMETFWQVLDADKGGRLESSSGQIASRDIVQFVPLQRLQGGEISVVHSLLAELPSKFLTYMRSRDIQPQQPRNSQKCT
ncbi:hypothetical protein MKW98_005484 [Papaver atlanticum]|uniref:C2 domain-containing protein n=1 Tax=Papaver atlanticum TaxID=357466 RepID=A0AAD4XS80_9MAGN|nr:hypothetical protein MKW98_005484 [Papaver atlanticum]